jgi:hypothetical protein
MAVTRAEAAVGDGESRLAGLERDRDALVVARGHRAKVETSLSERRSLLEKARQAERLTAERDVARERFERYRQAAALSDEIVALEQGHPSEHALPVLRQVVERLRVLDREIAELSAQLGDGASAVEYEIVIPEPRWRTFAIAAAVLAVAGLAAALVGFFSSQFPALVAGLVGAVVGLGLAAYARTKRREAFDFRRHQQLRDDEIARRLRGRSQLEEDLKRHVADRDTQLASLQLADLPSAEDLLSREDAHVQAIGRARAQLEGLVGKAPTETLPTLRDAAALDIEQKTGALEALGPIAKEPRARERLEVEVHDQEAALERARDDEADARARVEQNPVDAEQVAVDVEQLADRRQELAAIQRRIRVYQLALDAIVRAERSTMRKATRYLEKRMRGDLEKLTGARYRRVRVDDATLDIRVFAPERGDWVPVEELSQGSLDQVYLAARLGLVRLVTQDCRPPLVFDDPFVTFDDDRAARAVGVLRELAADFQVIYLTTSARYDAQADRVVVLAGPSAFDTAPDDTEEAGAPAVA